MRKNLPLPEGCVTACRACAHRSWEVAASAAQKMDFLCRTLAPWTSVLQQVQQPAENRRWGYRTRVRLSARWLHGRWAVGMEPRGDFIPLPHCPIHAGWLNAWLGELLPRLPGPEEFPLRYVVQSGSLTTLILRASPASVTAKLPRLLHSFQFTSIPKEVRGLFLHAHPAAGRRLFAKNGWFAIFGSEWEQDEAGLWHGPAAFQQALPELANAALEEAQKWLQPAPGDAVADLYCGVGSSLVRWLNCGAQALGIESTGEAVRAAQRNAPTALLFQGCCRERLPQLRSWQAGHEQVRRLAYVNPPRTGLEPEVTAWLTSEYRPERLAYLSCSVGTLRRDLKELQAAGYSVECLQPFDFFPQTHHVETLACLQRAATP